MANQSNRSKNSTRDSMPSNASPEAQGTTTSSAAPGAGMAASRGANLDVESMRQLLSNPDPRIADQARQVLQRQSTALLGQVTELLVRPAKVPDALQSMWADAAGIDTAPMTEQGLGPNQERLMAWRKQVGAMTDPLARYVAAKELHDLCQGVRSGQVEEAKAPGEALNRISDALKAVGNGSLMVQDVSVAVMTTAAKASADPAAITYSALAVLGQCANHIFHAFTLLEKGHLTEVAAYTRIFSALTSMVTSLVTVSLKVPNVPPNLAQKVLTGFFKKPTEDAIKAILHNKLAGSEESAVKIGAITFAKSMSSANFNLIFTQIASEVIGITDKQTLRIIDKLSTKVSSELMGLLMSSGKS